MALPRNPEARIYYSSAKQWLDDAQFILENGQRTRAAVYLAGYAVECFLKALILAGLPPRKRVEVQDSKTLYTHNLQNLKDSYLTLGGQPLPRQVAQDLLAVSDFWETDLRYRPKGIKYPFAVGFLETVARIANWADGRL